MHFLFIAALFATFLGLSVHAFSLKSNKAPKDQPIVISYNQTQLNIYTAGVIPEFFHNYNQGYQAEVYANAPIVDCESKTVGIAAFNVEGALRDGKLYLQEEGTYFFDTTGSSITYTYWYLHSTGTGSITEAMGFANGQVVTAVSSGSSGIYAGKEFLITITVVGRIRKVVITKK